MIKRAPIITYFVTLGLVATVPLMALLGFNIYAQYQTEQADAIAHLDLLRQASAQQIGTYLRDVEFILGHLSRDPAFQTMDRAQMVEALKHDQAPRPDLANLALLDQEGLILAQVYYAPPTPDYTMKQFPWFREGLEAEGFHISQPFQGEVTKKWTCVLSYPVLDPAGRRIATLVAPLNLSELSRRFFSEMPSADSIISVIDQSGVLLMRSFEADKWIGTTTEQIKTAFDRSQTGLKTGEITGRDGRRRIYSLDGIKDTTWFIGVTLPRENIFASADANLRRSLLLLAGLALVLALVISWLARNLNRPIISLAHSARAQMQGQAGSLALEAGPAEIADTARAFNEMLVARRRAEASLQESEQRYSTVVDQTGQMVYDVDLATGRIAWFGAQAVERTTGYTLAEFPVTDLAGCEEFTHADDRAAASARFVQCLATGEPYLMEYRFRQKDGSYRNVEDHGVFLLNPAGRPYRMLGRMHDITERKRAAEDRQRMEKKLLETQKLESLGVLAGGIAHDFNNLLTGILGNASLARMDLPATSPIQHIVEQIEQAAHRAADLCKQMLAYSGKGRFVIQRIDLNELLQDTTQLLALSISKKAVLRYNLAAKLPAIQADASQIRQVVMNLVINASEALGDHNGTITLSTGRLAIDAGYLSHSQLTGELTPGEYVYLEVGDTGNGMNPETLARIFDPFFTTKFTGRGLGLAAVHGIVRGHKGAIKVYSEPGKGTTFKLFFPIIEGDAESLATPVQVASNWRGSGRLLVVDDEESVRQVASRIAERLGFTVDTAADGLEGLELFRRQPEAYAVVLLDLTMPRLDGEETFRQLRQLRPEVCVVLMSGFNKVDAINRFLGKGLAGFVQKPFEVDTLASELRRALESSRPPI